MLAQAEIDTPIGAIVREISTLVESLLAAAAAPDEAIAAVEAVGRVVDAARVSVASPLVRDPGLVEQLGHASATAAVASIARISERSARTRLRVASAVSPVLTLTGASLPAPHPLVREALHAGEIGLDAAAAVVTQLDSVAGRTPQHVLEVAESAMVGLARGVQQSGETVAAAVSVDYLTGELRQLAAAVDPDGARPREERATRRREFCLGAPDEDGLVPAYGRLMPEVGVLLSGMLEAHRRSPRFTDSSSAIADPRTPGQRRHDALSEIILAAANTDGAPRLDGSPVSVLVTVSASDLSNPDDRDGDPIGAMADSRFPISRRSVERFIDASGYRVVTLDEQGAAVGISSPQRCFTPSQRLAIAARDGHRCLTPGCTSPHYALQAHHVIPDRENGPTSTDNGILLCYWHHRIVDTGPWQYRMVGGIPHVRGPGAYEWARARPPVNRAA
ncbi:hypothetical protein BH11ACT3_BH11ACT3_06180 [soil metagenome]